jgi:hypothetical protein
MGVGGGAEGIAPRVPGSGSSAASSSSSSHESATTFFDLLLDEGTALLDVSKERPESDLVTLPLLVASVDMAAVANPKWLAFSVPRFDSRMNRDATDEVFDFVLPNSPDGRTAYSLSRVIVARSR